MNEFDIDFDHEPSDSSIDEIEAWRQLCKKCNDEGLDNSESCPYYGEPNGCNSPTPGRHPVLANDPFIDPKTGLAICPFCRKKAVLSRQPIVDGWLVGCRTAVNEYGLPCPGWLGKQTVAGAYPTKQIAMKIWNNRNEKPENRKS